MPVRNPAAAATAWLGALWVALSIALLCVLAGCAAQQGGSYGYRLNRTPSHYYPPPGPPDDPWGPYIRQAAARFSVPEPWIREVMRQESGGDETAVSPAGAMGLMQVIPSTYETLREQYGLGDDPFEPHDNIMAGAAYIREMYDRYGSPGFLAAYNAGPQRVDDYLATGDPLPNETVNYVASIAPRIAGTTPETGPLAIYGGQGGVQYAAATGGGAVVTASEACDPDAAYDPSRPCAPAPTIAVVAAPVPVAPAPAAGQSLLYDPNATYGNGAPQEAAGACDPDAAYDPTRPCAPATTLAVVTNPAPLPPTPAATGALPYTAAAAGPPTAPAMPAAIIAVSSSPAGGDWGIQVGAFVNPVAARAAAETARRVAPSLLGAARLELPLTEPFGATVLYRARLTDLSARAASEACTLLMQQQLACMVVAPGHG
jgi:D-alanyl-D-alanine carboxypeptidase